ncbi:MAG: glycosyltransferase [Anaerolineae bacterium]|nr:glycosyltransferase [Anaerolineae bacterium]MDW8173991.1 glycosyltransferase [Anaerolineae bacterium]
MNAHSCLPKLLIVVSSLDLTQPFSATPAWWQLLKGLYEIGTDVIVTPYQGAGIESLWWRAESNPAYWQGEVFRLGRALLRRLRPPAPPPDPSQQSANAQGGGREGLADRLTRQVAQTLIAPLWERHLDSILRRHSDTDAVIFLTVPLNHLRGVAAEIRRKHNKPILYYDGDVPASLPNLRGFASGFRMYQGADLDEYDGFISNSLGGLDMLRSLGARRAHVLYYGADPDVFNPLDVEQDIDAFFYGHGQEYRAEWIRAMITEPSLALEREGRRFAVRGTYLGGLGRAELLPYLSFSKLRIYACRSKLNLCITRGAHASVYGSSSSRPFELAALGCCIVSNPYAGLELWFEPDREIIVVHSAEEALERYRHLLAHDAERQAVGQAARRRLLAEHTYRHRARQLLDIVREYL